MSLGKTWRRTSPRVSRIQGVPAVYSSICTVRKGVLLVTPSLTLNQRLSQGAVPEIPGQADHSMLESCWFFFNCGKTHNIKFTILTMFKSLQFSSARNVPIVVSFCVYVPLSTFSVYSFVLVTTMKLSRRLISSQVNK